MMAKLPSGEPLSVIFLDTEGIYVQVPLELNLAGNVLRVFTLRVCS